jgi:hypothetical protein
MSFLQRLILSNQQPQHELAQVAGIEQDYVGKSCEQLFQILVTTQDPELIAGLKRLLLSRGHSRKVLQQILSPLPYRNGC